MAGGAPSPPQLIEERGPTLWAVMYFHLWLNIALLAGLIYWPRQDEGGLALWIAWVVGGGIAAICGAQLNMLIHDSLTALSLRDRTFLGILICALPLGAVLPDRMYVLTDGLLWTAASLMLIAVRPMMARQCLLASMIVAFFACYHVGESAIELALLAGFAVNWLLAAGAVHYNFLGGPHGLGGWWPARMIARNGLTAALPALAAGAALWWLWPAAGLHPHPEADIVGIGVPPPAREALINRMQELKLLELIWHGLIGIMLTALAFFTLHYLRKYLLRRSKLAGTQILPGQVAQLDYIMEAPSRAAPTLGGLRGQIVAMWGRWADALGREGPARDASETAREYSAKIDMLEPAAAPPDEMLELLERAHYGEAEPTARELARMRELVQEELSRQSLRRGAPQEAVD